MKKIIKSYGELKNLNMGGLKELFPELRTNKKIIIEYNYEDDKASRKSRDGLPMVTRKFDEKASSRIQFLFNEIYVRETESGNVKVDLFYNRYKKHYC